MVDQFYLLTLLFKKKVQVKKNPMKIVGSFSVVNSVVSACCRLHAQLLGCRAHRVGRAGLRRGRKPRSSTSLGNENIAKDCSAPSPPLEVTCKLHPQDP